MSRDHVQSAATVEAPFLELLARGASAEAYEQPVLLARAEGLPLIDPWAGEQAMLAAALELGGAERMAGVAAARFFSSWSARLGVVRGMREHDECRQRVFRWEARGEVPPLCGRY